MWQRPTQLRLSNRRLSKHWQTPQRPLKLRRCRECLQPARFPAGFPSNLTSQTPEQTPVGAAPVSEIARPAETPPQAEARAGFTVSRDGYVPAKPLADAERDPFDFDLGPSPFETKVSVKTSDAPIAIGVSVNSAAPSVTAKTAAEPAREPMTDGGIDAGAAALARLTGSQPKAVFETSAPAVMLAPAVVPAPAFRSLSFRSLSSDPVSESPRSYFVAAPSVAATLAPKPADVPAAPPAAAPIGFAVDVVAVGDAVQPTVQPTVHIETSGVVARIETIEQVDGDASPEQPVAVVEDALHLTASTDAAQSTMEDTVADLLRPMLRTWLAENMPRIVERALRREVSEQLHSEHKTAAE